MAEKHINKLHYGQMVDQALRTVLRETLAITARQGLPGPHYFYITFVTAYPGVVISQHMLEEYPDTLSIIIQNKYWGLKVEQDYFEVSLTFHQINEDLRIPFDSVVEFYDPAAKFKLQFDIAANLEKALTEHEKVAEHEKVTEFLLAPTVLPASQPTRSQEFEPSDGGAKVLNFEAFRKK